MSEVRFAAFPDLYEQQRRNKRKTALVVGVFILFIAFLGYGVDLFYFGNDPLGVLGERYGFPFATVASIVVGAISASWGLSGGARAVLSSARAQPVEPGDSRYQVLNNVVDEMAIASGIPRPPVYVIPDPDPNAFATGRDPQHSAIAVTEGLLSTLNREELQGVIAHEMSHIRNYDIRLTTVVAALVGAAFLLADWGRMGMRFGGGGRGKSRSRGSAAGPLGAVLLVLWLVTLILAPLLSRLLAMAVSRGREYLADATGAELTRNPLGLASALTKLQNAGAPTASIRRGSAHLCIVDPLGKRMNFREGAVAELFGTHPPLEKRITILRAMAYAPQPAGAVGGGAR